MDFGIQASWVTDNLGNVAGTIISIGVLIWCFEGLARFLKRAIWD